MQSLMPGYFVFGVYKLMKCCYQASGLLVRSTTPMMWSSYPEYMNYYVKSTNRAGM